MIRFNHKPGLAAYVTCGDPDLATTEQIVLAAIDAGADVIELGVPFSDPVADGRAKHHGRRAGHWQSVLDGVRFLQAGVWPWRVADDLAPRSPVEHARTGRHAGILERHGFGGRHLRLAPYREGPSAG